jgi:hypothetical protein
VPGGADAAGGAFSGVEPALGTVADYPGPFQRYSWLGAFVTYPVSTIAKVFLQQDDDGDGTLTNFVCSGSVVFVGSPQADRFVTAGHCVHNGLNGVGANGGWSTNFIVCPSYNAAGVNPKRGCWTATNLATSTEWYAFGNPEADLGGAHIAPTGTVWLDEIGDVTGELGRAWNWSSGRALMVLGYPHAPPFDGRRIVVCATVHWYNFDWGPLADNEYVGCDLNGGSSGGPWILGLNHGIPGTEYGDTDGDASTDPGSNWLNGVNIHSRCLPGGCGVGVFTQEMGSVPFRAGTTMGEWYSEDFFAFLAGIP